MFYVLLYGSFAIKTIWLCARFLFLSQNEAQNSRYFNIGATFPKGIDGYMVTELKQQMVI